jgi:preprotein translocase subunit SecG
VIFAATIFFVILAVLSLLWTRNAFTVARKETPAQRRARIQNEQDTVVVISMMNDR